jgi:hypothetical protein
VQLTADSSLVDLLREVISYGSPTGEDEYALPDRHDIALPIHFRYRDHELSLLAAITTFGTAQDITLSEIAIETYFPADARTAEALRRIHRTWRDAPSRPVSGALDDAAVDEVFGAGDVVG